MLECTGLRGTEHDYDAKGPRKRQNECTIIFLIPPQLLLGSTGVKADETSEVWAGSVRQTLKRIKSSLDGSRMAFAERLAVSWLMLAVTIDIMSHHLAISLITTEPPAGD